MQTDSANLWALSEQECRSLLTGVQVGRVIVSMDAMPAAFPVNYIVIGSEIYFRTVDGTKLSTALDRTVVAFQVDAFDPLGTSGWTVLIVGPGRLVTDPAESALLDAAGVYGWTAEERTRSRYVAIGIERISGRRLWGTEDAAAAPTTPVSSGWQGR